MKRDRYVYCLAELGDDPGTIYVGVGKRSDRMNVHLRYARSGVINGNGGSIEKQQYLIDTLARGIPIEVLIFEDGLTPAEAYELEVYCIATLGRRADGGRLLNATAGGFGSRDPVPSTRARMSAAKRGKPQPPEIVAKRVAKMRGHTTSPETRAKIAAAHRGRKRSEETRAKIAEAVSRSMTPERRAQISAAKRGRKMPPEAVAAGPRSSPWSPGVTRDPREDRCRKARPPTLCRAPRPDFCGQSQQVARDAGEDYRRKSQ